MPMLDPDEVHNLTLVDVVIDIHAGTGGDKACLLMAKIMAGYKSVAKESWGLRCSPSDGWIWAA